MNDERKRDERPTDEEGEPLSGGNMAAFVLRIGDTVRRPAGPWTPTVHRLLHYLEERGFEGAPRALGLDSEGREMLSFVPGLVVQPDHRDLVASEDRLAQVVRLIASYHQHSQDFPTATADQWREDFRDPAGSQEVICHNDLGPWNLIVGEEGWAFIDWDLAAPGRRLWDLGWAALSFIPLWPDSGLTLAQTMERIEVVVRAYGLPMSERGALLQCALERARWEADTLLTRGSRGEQPYARLLAEGHEAFWRKTTDHLEVHFDSWRAGLG